MKFYLPKIRFLSILFISLSTIIGQNAFADSLTPLHDNKETKLAIVKLFADTPQMISIAQCESSFQQYTPKGSTFTGGGGRYIGVFQIGKGHTNSAKKLGFDIYTLDGNLGYARYMYQYEGIQPWRGCVKSTSSISKPSKKGVKIATISTKRDTPLITKNIGIGAKDPEVKVLQQILNASNFFVARSGPGSSGNETNTFNIETREALKRFQCVKNIACNGTEDSTGYGYVGPETRAVLLKEVKKQK